jgi:hypothetical protein
MVGIIKLGIGIVTTATMVTTLYLPARSFSPVSVMENVLAMDCGSRPTAGRSAERRVVCLSADRRKSRNGFLTRVE